MSDAAAIDAEAIDEADPGDEAGAEPTRTDPPPTKDRGKTVHGEVANAGHRVLAPDDAEVEAYLETALKAPAELKLHVRGALANGVTVDEIKEVLLHATVYCGVPAGLEAFKAANEVLVAEGVVSDKPAAKPPGA